MARDHLIGNYSVAIGFYIRFILLYLLLRLVTSSFFGLPTIAGFVISVVTYIAVITVIYMIKAGLCSVFMKINCGINPLKRDLYFGFSHMPKRTFSCSIILATIEALLLMIPAEIYSYLSTAEGLQYIVMLLIIDGIGYVIYTYISICFSQVFFLMNDFPDKTASELMILSNWLMKGQKLKYLFFILSFIPMHILGFFSMFIGYIWISPYILTSKTCYYLDLVKSKTAQ